MAVDPKGKTAIVTGAGSGVSGQMVLNHPYCICTITLTEVNG